MPTTPKPEQDDRTITSYERKQVNRANTSGKRPVVFVHGLWLLPSSWDRWAKVFEAAGYSAVVPGWPDDPETVADAKEHPEVFARKSIGQIADHFEAVITTLDQSPPSSATASVASSPRSSPAAVSRRRRSPSIRHRSVACCRCRSRHCAQHRRCCATRPTATAPCR